MNLSPSPVQQFFGNNGRPLVGGLLFTYEAGTSTPIATYSDETGTPNTNPIELDFRGECRIWLDPDFAYKFVLAPKGDSDPPTRPIWTADNITAATTLADVAQYVNTTVNQQFIAQRLWPRTADEIAAGVTPTSYIYPGAGDEPLVNVKRYGAVGDGTTDDTGAFAAGLKVSNIFVPYGTYRLTEPLALLKFGIVGAGWAQNNNGPSVTLMFENIGATEGALYTDTDSPRPVSLIPLSGFRLRAKDWSSVDGYGMDITQPVNIGNVEVAFFKKSGVFMHNTAVDGIAPYNSILTSLHCIYNGEHGLLIGTGANTITIVNFNGKWNGTPDYAVAPSSEGNFDGFHIERDGAGNPGGAFYSYTPEGITIIGGDCSYNSRYGWWFGECQGGVFMPSYAEFNMKAAPGDVRLANGLTHCFIVLNSIHGGVAGVDFSMTGTVSNGANTNRVFVGGMDCGSGNNNVASSRYTYPNPGWHWYAYDGTQANAAVILPYSDGSARLARLGSTGGWIMDPASFNASSLPPNSSFQSGAIIFVPDDSGGATLAWNDGSDWRRVRDNTVISA